MVQKQDLLNFDVYTYNAKGFSLQISESWIRGYQILENRTHPEINMQGASGYVLTGIKCE